MRDFTARKTQLEARLAVLDARVHAIEDQLDDPVTQDWEDRAIEREGDEVLEGLGNQGLQEIEMIRAALARIVDGTYGECLKCGEEISSHRLDVVPHAPLCRTCANAT